MPFLPHTLLIPPNPFCLIPSFLTTLPLYYYYMPHSSSLQRKSLYIYFTNTYNFLYNFVSFK